MASVPVELPDDLREFVDGQVRRGEFATASQYILALVEAARDKKSEIESALLQGLESGPAEKWTRQEWDAIKERVIARHGAG